MLEKIIVGVDCREGGRDALALGDALASALGSTLVAVHAYAYDYYARRGPGGELERMLHDTALEHLNAELRAAGVEARPLAIAASSPGRALHLAVDREHADLVVVGSAHHGPVGRVLAGDVGTSTLHGSSCPVLVAARRATRETEAIETIGVGYDGSPESRAALHLARDMAAAMGARLELIIVVPPPVGTPWYPALAEATDSDRAAQADAEAMLAAAVEEIGGDARGTVATGDAADELIHHSERVDLLVVGSRSYGPLTRLLLGSTSTRLMRHAACPVLVLPRGAEEQDGRDTHPETETVDA